MSNDLIKKAAMVVVFAVISIIHGTPDVSAQSSTAKIEDSVVMIFSTLRQPDLSRPWGKQSPRDATGSGLVIEGKRILTNAHVVLYAAQIQVQGSQGGNKVSATAEFMAPGIDLAVLKLEDESFFDSHPALPRANVLPHVKDAVMVYGYPTGGNSISITNGIVSRIDFVSYNYGISGLRIQIDAAINPGNSGGPAVVGEKVIGLAFSYIANSQNIGYIIPCEEIEIFLKDIADGRYDGKPAMYDSLQTFENSALRTFLKLDKSAEGIIVHEPFSADENYPLKKWDVIAKIGDIPVDNQGNSRLNDTTKINFSYFIQKLAKNNAIALTVLRKGAEKQIQLPLSLRLPKLIKPLQNEYPPYFICGPIPFSIATEELASALSGSSVLSNMGNPMFTRRSEKPAFDDEQLVVVPSPLFTHPLSKGYQAPAFGAVKSVNNIQVKNLHHLIEIIRDSKEEFLTFDFYGYYSETMVFPRKDFVASTETVLNDNGIRAQGSSDTLAIWNNVKR
jgi:S1-C subfamily serine protease